MAVPRTSDVSDRMTRLEVQIDTLSGKVDKTDLSVIRVHERLDQIESGVNTLISQAIAEHSSQKDHLLGMRFSGIEKTLVSLEENSEKRLEATLAGFGEIKKYGMQAFLAITLGGAAAFSYVIVWLIQHAAGVEAIVKLTEKAQ